MLPLLLAGMAAGGLGSFLQQQEAKKQAVATAAARNAVLADNQRRQDAFGAENRGTFNTAVGGFSPEAQGAALTGAQGTRVANNTGAITAEDPNAIPLSDSAPGAVRSVIADRMKMYGDRSRRDATNQGNLSGYGDVTLGNNIGVSHAAGQVGTVNNFAQGQNAILPNLQDFAEIQAKRPPSVLGPFLQLAGNFAGAASGAGGMKMPGFGLPGGTGWGG